MTRAVAFDLWETLITNPPDVSHEQKRVRLTRMEEILASRGLESEAERLEQAFRKQWSVCHDLYWSEDRDVPCRRQVEHFLEALELDPASFDERALSELEEAFAGAALEVLPKLVPGAGDVVRTLKARGHRIGLISNTGRTPGSVLRDILDRLGLAASIDAMVFSNEHGVCKPQPSIFAELREALGVDYADIVFVGDNLYVDVHGAQRCGMRGVHFVPPERGDAIAPAVEHGLEIVPDARITSLYELLDL